MALGNSSAFQPPMGNNALPSGHKNSFTVTAGEAVGSPRLVTLVAGEAMLFDPAASIARTVLGITLNAAILGDPVEIQTVGVVSGLSGLSANAVYYGSALGVLTTTPPVNGVLQPVGIALSTTELLLNLDDPVVTI